MSRFDCLCAGVIVADHICHPIDHLPQPGELILSETMELTIGGCASNTATDLAKLGVQVAVSGCVGDDIFGRHVHDSLSKSGVACDYLNTSSTSQTSGSFVVNVKGEDRRFIHTVGANAEFTGKQVTQEMLQSTRVLALGGYCLCPELTAENVSAMFQTAKQLGVTTILDVVIPKEDDYWSFLNPVLPHTDVFLPNNDEGEIITGSTDPVRQAEQYRSAGAKNVIITCGGTGAVVATENELYRVGTYPTQFVDGTGSGDAFVAGYIYGLIKDCDPLQCLRYGSALGASCVRSSGATTGIFSADELEQFVASHKLAVEPI
jgi:sugar/nucleoside kinase (ribokinase family)